MIIHSQFKDYYDHVAHLYGGGDPSIQYIRKRLVSLRQTCGHIFTDTLTVEHTGLVYSPHILYNDPYKFKWLSVVGKSYLLVQTYTGDVYSPTYSSWKLFSQKEHPELWSRFNVRRKWSRDTELKSVNYVGKFSAALVELSRKINAPVFTFESGETTAVVDGEIPILSNLGMPKIITAEQLYQDISYFVGNIMKDSPDMMPPSKMSDKEKILQHGFDNRISFRHRV